MKWAGRLRLLSIPTLCAFLSFVFVVIRPWSRISGQWAFLAYTSNLIFFFPRGRIGPQLEATVLGVTGGTIGIAWACATLAVAAYCGRRYGADSNESRAILGLGLALLSLMAGLIRSYARRFNAFSKIMLFFPIFQLTSQQAVTHMTAELFLEQFYIVIFSALFALIPTLLIAPHKSSHPIGTQIDESIQTICTLLPVSLSPLLEVHFPVTAPVDSDSTGPVKSLEAQNQTPSQTELAKKLKITVLSLHVSSSSYFKESLALEQQSALPDIIKSIQRLQRNPLLGQTSHVPGERIQAALYRSFPRSRPGTPRRRSRSRHERQTSVSSEADLPPHHSVHRRRPRHLTSYLRPADSNATIALSTRPDLKDTSQNLVDAIIETLHTIDRQLKQTYGWSSPPDTEKTLVPEGALVEAKAHLEEVLNGVQRALGVVLGSMDRDAKKEHHRDHVTYAESTDVTDVLRNKDRFRLAFYMTALLDLSRDVHGLANTALSASIRVESTPSTWLTFFRLGWMKDREEVPQGTDGVDEADLAAEEEQPKDEMKEYQDMDYVTATLHQRREAAATDSTVGNRFNRAWKRTWNQHGVVKARITFSRSMHAIKHSRHVLFSIKLAAGISLLAVPALLPPGFSGRKWYDTSRGGWMVVSYMFVLEDTTGAILKVGFLRGLGCFIGAVVGFVCTLIAKQNPYGLVVLATACTVPISWHILFNTSTPGLGVSTGITLPPLMFIPYLGLAHGQADFTLAWYRFTDIMIGTFAAVLVGTWVWPVHARVQYFRAVSSMMERITEFYLRMSRDLVRSSLVYRVDDKQYDRLEGKIKRDFGLSRSLVSIQRQEISLLPRPVKLYSEVIDASERLLETLIEIRILRFSVPRKATVLDVLPIRRELISTILINLWACGHAFGSRSPLPQFLPSPRVPLSELMEVTDEHAQDVRVSRHPHVEPNEADTNSDDTARKRDVSPATVTESYQAEMAILYAMAENEALGEVCNILEELVAAARTLFGTQTFLDTT
ncbi:hypothetical protein IAR55_004338 [Kwoniella newhampshirensis]|uniref:Integral membrane bound transporter domain-containing protein n=1 Tax=Kwoniella newhampshirensis TaxID=1651941 RepID=A0AAW0YX12_9TREE